MANIVPFRSVSGAKESYLRLRQTVRSLREKTSEQVKSLARTGEIGLAMGAAGMLNGYAAEPQIGPVPVDLGVGAALKVLAFAMDSEMAEHVNAFGDGFLGAFVYRRAAAMGVEAAASTNNVTPAELVARRMRGENDDGTPIVVEE